MTVDTDAQGAFPATRWSLVARACKHSDRTAARALDELLRAYSPVLRRHLIRQMAFSPHDADDLLQEFVSRKVIQKRALEGAEAAKGRFRVFLLAVLKNFAVSELRRFKAKKRGPLNDKPLSLDEAPEVVTTGSDIHRSFNLDWARQTIALAVERMRQECVTKGRRDLWDVFSSRVLEPLLDQAPQPSYETLVGRFGFQSPTQASNLLITAKRMFRRSLEEVVRDTLADEARVADEIRALKAILAG